MQQNFCSGSFKANPYYCTTASFVSCRFANEVGVDGPKHAGEELGYHIVVWVRMKVTSKDRAARVLSTRGPRTIQVIKI